MKRQRATLTLTPITLPQVGSFLEAWRSAEPRWTIASIDLSPSGKSNNLSQRGTQGSALTDSTDLALRAVLVLETLFAEEPTPESATPMSSLMPRNP